MAAFGSDRLPTARQAARWAAALLAAAGCVGASTARDPGGPLTLQNGRVRLRFDPAAGAIVALAADAEGRGRYGGELLAAEGVRLFDDPVALACRGAGRRATCRGRDGAAVDLSLAPAATGVQVVVTAPRTARAIVRARLPQTTLFGLFDRGMVQFVAGQSLRFAATRPLDLFYTMDRTRGSVAVRPDGAAYATLVSGGAGVSGIDLAAAPTPADAPGADRWSAAALEPPSAGGRTLAFSLFANDHPYPAHQPGRRIAAVEGAADRDATLIAAYGSAAGVLGTYLAPGSAYPTLALPRRTYGEAYDFFDPDAWSTVNTLAFSGDPLLAREAKAVLEHARAGMRPDGQLPHHFEPSGPTYVSIAKSKQTGPNIFWTLASIDYAVATGDEAWLRARWPDLERATDWLLAAYDPARGLIHADGPLFIDVFRRDGFTLDTNMMAAHLLDRMTSVARFAGDPAAARRYAQVAAALREGLRARLWAGDHFVTQLNPDGSRRDLVDYDGNYGAVAFGAPADRGAARRVLARLDAGPHTHPGGYGTWVSEVRYDRDQCYGGNDGDSDTAMARILWLDLASRVATGDHAMFEALYRKNRDLILDRVWMTERIDAQGRPIRAPGYHEYPEIAAMVARELRYGIRLEADTVEVRPFGVDRFDYAIGGLRVAYGPGALRLQIPGASPRRIVVAGLRPGRRYRLSPGGTAVVSPAGELRFGGRAGTAIVATPLDG